jgi:hypothetical protein
MTMSPPRSARKRRSETDKIRNVTAVDQLHAWNNASDQASAKHEWMGALRAYTP